MNTQSMALDPANSRALSLLDEPLISYRDSRTGSRVMATLPDLFAAMGRDEVRDFPLLRPHQRHPWHAFLVQLAAIALHRSGRTEPISSAAEWRTAVLSITPDDPHGCAWCLIAPVNQPAFMQPPEPSGTIGGWKNTLKSPDELDMLVTSKNHDLKAARMVRSSPEEWVYALVSLQTQEGFLGAGNYGISRMNKGFASRCGVGLVPAGGWGARWVRDVKALVSARDEVVEKYELTSEGGHALIWTLPWDGSSSLAFGRLDPWYIEICRRVRLTGHPDIQARVTGSKVPRIAAQELNGRTGDPWMPIDVGAERALTIGRRGFDYRLACEILFKSKFSEPVAQEWQKSDDGAGVYLLAQGVARGQGKTEGYHERRIPLSKTVERSLSFGQTNPLAILAAERIDAIGEVRRVLWTALVMLFGNAAKDDSGKDKEASDAVKERANRFAQPFEVWCDARFFLDFNDEVEALDRQAARQQWLGLLVGRAEEILRSAFEAGPRSGQLRYRAQSASLGVFRSMLRSSKKPGLAQALQAKGIPSPHFSSEETHESL